MSWWSGIRAGGLPSQRTRRGRGARGGLAPGASDRPNSATMRLILPIDSDETLDADEWF